LKKDNFVLFIKNNESSLRRVEFGKLQIFDLPVADR